MKHKELYSFEVFWSEDDGEYVARLARADEVTYCPFPSLSWLDKSPVQALLGLIRLIEDTEEEIEKEDQ